MTVWELLVPLDNLFPWDYWMLFNGLLWVPLSFFFLASHIYISSFLQEKRAPELSFSYQPLVSIWLMSSHKAQLWITYRSHYRSHKVDGNRRLIEPRLWYFSKYIFCLTENLSIATDLSSLPFCLHAHKEKSDLIFINSTDSMETIVISKMKKNYGCMLIILLGCKNQNSDSSN